MNGAVHPKRVPHVLAGPFRCMMCTTTHRPPLLLLRHRYAGGGRAPKTPGQAALEQASLVVATPHRLFNMA